MSELKISLAFMTYKSSSYIEQQLQKNYFDMSDGLIDEIIIQDDFTEDYETLKKYETDKIKVFQNSEHMFPLLGRVNLLNNCKNDWVLLMDCDNFLDKNSFDKIKEITPQAGTIYCPDFSRPMFGYKEFSNTEIDLKYVAERLSYNNCMRIFINTGNYLVPRKEYLEVASNIDSNYSQYTVDCVYYNYLWLKSGRKLFCVKDYEYDHGMRGDSYYMTHSGISDQKLQEVYQLYYDNL